MTRLIDSALLHAPDEPLKQPPAHAAGGERIVHKITLLLNARSTSVRTEGRREAECLVRKTSLRRQGTVQIGIDRRISGMQSPQDVEPAVKRCADGG